MSEGYAYDTHDHDEDWPLVEDAFCARYAGKAWPPRAAAMELRWLLVERWIGRLKARDFPTVRALAEKWGWKRNHAAEFIADTAAWQTDPKRQMSLDDLRGDRAMGANLAAARTDGGRTADGERTAGTEERREVATEPDGGRTADGRTADAVRASSARVHQDHLSPKIPEVAPAVAVAPPPKRRPPKAPKPPTPTATGYREAIDAFDSEHRAVFGSAYPWQFVGRDADGARVKSWLAVARVTVEDPGPGVERIRLAARAYLRAVERGIAFPRGEPSHTRHFTRDIARWLQTDPESTGPPARGSPANDRLETLEALRLARERLAQQEPYDADA